ncbi:hypothetical protein DY000_02031018 [Brassica cretica]|uniref:Uncharacterized protein n=1 Tax=Brassica cretica TaxID=69181 RepID=A0ABQ7DMS0_BRACR|nr:hypothetical protein DY000_02031018 [Brassica cretica]
MAQSIETPLMAQSSIMFADLKARPRSSTLRFGEARNATLTPATVNVHLFKAGSVFSSGSFDVTGCNQNYRLFEPNLKNSWEWICSYWILSSLI